MDQIEKKYSYSLNIFLHVTLSSRCCHERVTYSLVQNTYELRRCSAFSRKISSVLQKTLSSRWLSRYVSQIYLVQKYVQATHVQENQFWNSGNSLVTVTVTKSVLFFRKPVTLIRNTPVNNKSISMQGDRNRPSRWHMSRERTEQQTQSWQRQERHPRARNP